MPFDCRSFDKSSLVVIDYRFAPFLCYCHRCPLARYIDLLSQPRHLRLHPKSTQVESLYSLKLLLFLSAFSIALSNRSASINASTISDVNVSPSVCAIVWTAAILTFISLSSWLRLLISFTCFCISCFNAGHSMILLGDSGEPSKDREDRHVSSFAAPSCP